MIQQHRQPIDGTMNIYVPGRTDLEGLSAAYKMTAHAYFHKGMEAHALGFMRISDLLGELVTITPKTPDSDLELAGTRTGSL